VSDRCACPGNGHPTAAPPRSVMKSRRLTLTPRSTPAQRKYQMGARSAKVSDASHKVPRPTSLSGQVQASRRRSRYGSCTPDSCQSCCHAEIFCPVPVPDGRTSYRSFFSHTGAAARRVSWRAARSGNSPSASPLPRDHERRNQRPRGGCGSRCSARWRPMNAL
jgi:hypothetical protein